MPVVDVVNLSGKKVGEVELADAIFGAKVNPHLLHEATRWYQREIRSGTHKTKDKSEVSGAGRKLWRQKGTGRARHGNKLAPQFRGGGKAFGPVPRSHAIDLPKKVRALALRHALSSKAKADELIILDKAELVEAKTQKLKAMFSSLGLDSALIIGGKELDNNFALAARNLPNIDVLAIAGLNVYDILRRRKLVLTKAALEAIEERFK